MLTPLELDIMKAVWQQSPITVRDVQLAIRSKRRLAYTTVMTTMNRLYLKGFLLRNLQSRAHLYEPAQAYVTVREAALDGLVQDYFDGSRETLADFLNGRQLDHDPPLQPLSQPPMHRPPALDETLL